MIQIVMMVCKLAQPEVCEQQHIQFAFQGSLQQCTFAAQIYIAQWAGDHPQWTVKNFHCEYPHSDDRADTAGPSDTASDAAKLRPSATSRAR